MREVTTRSSRACSRSTNFLTRWPSATEARIAELEHHRRIIADYLRERSAR